MHYEHYFLIALAVFFGFCALAGIPRSRRGGGARYWGEDSSFNSSRATTLPEAESPAKQGVKQLPSGPNSSDQEMKQQLELNEKRVEDLQYERAKDLCERILQQYQEELAKTDRMPFFMSLEGGVAGVDLAIVKELLRKKGWEATFSFVRPFSLVQLTVYREERDDEIPHRHIPRR